MHIELFEVRKLSFEIHDTESIAKCKAVFDANDDITRMYNGYMCFGEPPKRKTKFNCITMFIRGKFSERNYCCKVFPDRNDSSLSGICIYTTDGEEDAPIDKLFYVLEDMLGSKIEIVHTKIFTC